MTHEYFLFPTPSSSTNLSKTILPPHTNHINHSQIFHFSVFHPETNTPSPLVFLPNCQTSPLSQSYIPMRMQLLLRDRPRNGIKMGSTQPIPSPQTDPSPTGMRERTRVESSRWRPTTCCKRKGPPKPSPLSGTPRASLLCGRPGRPTCAPVDLAGASAASESPKGGDK